jgi:hypothetical protein
MSSGGIEGGQVGRTEGGAAAGAGTSAQPSGADRLDRAGDPGEDEIES